MLKRLRIKFIALTMAAIFVVLTCVSVAICVVDYRTSVDNVYRALESAVAFAGGIPDAQAGEDVPHEDRPPKDSEADDDASRPVIGGRDGGEHGQVIPMAVYETAEDGTLSPISEATTASIDEGILSDAASELAEADDGHGSIGSLGLYYAKLTTENGTYLAFADRTSASSWQALALLCGGIEIAALAVFLIISWFFSQWALRPVEHAWMQQQRFLADASHELKTPLTVILANVSILLRHPDKSIASQSQWIESTQTEAKCMQELVTDMLELASLKNEQGDNALAAAPPAADDSQKEDLDFSDLVESELLQFESIAFERGIAFESDLESGIFVRGDEYRLHRIASTLFDNACKYSEEGSAVSITLHRRAANVELSVHNEGAAIPAEDLPHIFDRFYRADKARTRSIGGYGLGLAIARETARAHGGDIVVTSSEREGTTFTVTLPALEAR